ncbi:MAG: type II toxin-antitoxin system RelB/DinJ family antitoxin [Gracilibacteraceae bacterium]|jgi:DNA-damage-inducible protein J|nr:type II toxin-antitoxin system RelB/DinJ family antitoxin [Gracilibacteraceae bacterium]
MSTANINLRTDSEIKAQAGQIFESLGLDMSTAINLFLRQTVKCNNLPFVIGTQAMEDAAVRPPFQFGCMAGKISISDDFDEPLEDFKEYME